MVSDTEMEADVEPSVETEERLEREQFEAAQRLARLEAAEAEDARQRAAAVEAAALQAAQKQRLRQVNTTACSVSEDVHAQHKNASRLN